MRVSSFLVGCVILALGLASAWAQEGPPPGGGPGGPDAGGRQGGRGGPGGQFRGGPGNPMFAMGMEIMRRFDTNGNITVEEDELRAGLAKIKERADDVYAILLQAFDANGDKKLAGDELQKVEEFIGTLMLLRQFDRNNDKRVEEAELGESWDDMAERCQRYNEGVTQRFDTNKDGKLDEKETADAKEAMRNMAEQWRGRGGAPRGAGGNPPPPQAPPPPPPPAAQ